MRKKTNKKKLYKNVTRNDAVFKSFLLIISFKEIINRNLIFNQENQVNRIQELS
jgi:hypothetical protein